MDKPIIYACIDNRIDNRKQRSLSIWPSLMSVTNKYETGLLLTEMKIIYSMYRAGYGVPLGSNVYYQCDTLIILRGTLIILRGTLNNLRATLIILRGVPR